MHFIKCTSLLMRGLQPTGIHSNLLGRRWYNPQPLIDMQNIKHRERAKQLQLSEARPKTFKPALDHIRLSRFGWEHKKAGSEGERRRRKSHKASVLAAKIGYISPRDYGKLRLYFPHMRLRYRFAPVDTNINLRRERQALPAHIA